MLLMFLNHSAFSCRYAEVIEVLYVLYVLEFTLCRIYKYSIEYHAIVLPLMYSDTRTMYLVHYNSYYQSIIVYYIYLTTYF